MRLAIAMLCTLAASCAWLPQLNEATCLPKAKLMRTDGKVDGAMVGVICSERILKGLL